MMKNTTVEWRDKYRSIHPDTDECNNTSHVDYQFPNPGNYAHGTIEHTQALAARQSFRKLLVDQLLLRKMDAAVDYNDIEKMRASLK